MSQALKIWKTFHKKPGGKYIFSRLLCIKIPYFSSISPLLETLAPYYCEVSMKKHAAVLNHLDTIHAIAICNLAELAAGTMTDASVPKTHSWILKGMQVEYLKKATTDLRAIATPTKLNIEWHEIAEYQAE
ncbi:hotdog fold domain-containing protein [Acinetobacter schindleri]|uniref:hotdog fold domain-containing protein n=1 Tax=Acinetobacter schindleri TaxID=108981 RepID=UPI003A85479B